MKNLKNLLSPLFVAMFLMLAVTACGGGGGGSSARDVFVVPNIPVENDISGKMQLTDSNGTFIRNAQFANANRIATPSIGVSLSVSVDNGQETTFIIPDDESVESLFSFTEDTKRLHILPTAVDATRIYLDDSTDEYLEFGYWLHNDRRIDYSERFYRNAFLRAGEGLQATSIDRVARTTATYSGRASGSFGNVFNAQTNTFSGGVDFVNANVALGAEFNGNGNVTVAGNLFTGRAFIGSPTGISVRLMDLVYNSTPDGQIITRGFGDYAGTAEGKNVSGEWIYYFYGDRGTNAPTHLGGYFRSPITNGVNGEVADIGVFGTVLERLN